MLAKALKVLLRVSGKIVKGVGKVVAVKLVGKQVKNVVKIVKKLGKINIFGQV